MKKFLFLLLAGLLVQSLWATDVPESGKFYKVKHSSGLYLTLDGGSFKIAKENSSVQNSHQVFQFFKESPNSSVYTIQVDNLRYMASDNKWNGSVLYRSGNEYAQFEVTVKNEYLTFKNLGQNKRQGANKCYLGTDKNENNSGVYTDKDGNDGKHYWNIVEVAEFEFPEDVAGPDVYPDEDLPDDDPRKNVYPGYKLVFAEEFSNTDGSRPPMGIWTYESGYKRNNEIQYYAVKDDNVWEENGVCVINGRRETNYVKDGKNVPWTSTSFRTNTTNNKYNWQFGIFEVRAKIPAYEGMWPAIWSTGIGAWPKYGEIDLLEWYGGRIHGNVCWGNTQWLSNTVDYATLNATDPNTEWGDEYHVWRMFWDYDHIEMWCDDVLVNNIDLNETYNPVSEGQAWSGKNPFRDVRHQIWLNLALGSSGGSLNNAPDNNYYLIDYARVYQKIGTDGTCLYYVNPYQPDATIKVPDKDATLSVRAIMSNDEEAPVEYYNLQGMRVMNPKAGQIVIRRQGKTAEKIVME